MKMKLYQVINFQFDIVATFHTLEAAKERIAELRRTYKETFYVIELNVVQAWTVDGEVKDD